MPYAQPGENMDYPTAWAVVLTTKPEEHHEKCSWRTENGALLCDCERLWDRWRELDKPSTELAVSLWREASLACV